MKPEIHLKMKRERSPESEVNTLQGLNKKIKMSGSATASGFSHEADYQSPASAHNLGDGNQHVATPHSAPARDNFDAGDQQQLEDKSYRNETSFSRPNVAFQRNVMSEPDMESEVHVPKPKPKRKSKSKKATAPPPPPATKIGDAFFEPGCPAIGCFLPAKTKGTRRPEKKDMIWRCHWEGCDKINWSLYRLNRHIKEKHTQNKFWICQKEGQAYPSKAEFEEHQRETGHVNTEMGR